MKRIRAFFSRHAWKVSFSFKRFFLQWFSIFAILWTFIDFADFYAAKAKANLWNPPVWSVLLTGILIAGWLSRPRLTRTVRLKDKDVAIHIKVDDIFRQKGCVAIIPANNWFKMDHVSEASVQVQYRDRFFGSEAEFNRLAESRLANEPHVRGSYNGEPVKEYALGTVIRLEPPSRSIKAAYLVATARLNPFGRAIPSRDDLRNGLIAAWGYIAARGGREPLVIPIMGSGRHRINLNRFELMHDIVQSFVQAVDHNKFTEELTIVIHPDSFIRHQYSLNEMEEYLNYVCKFGA
ncbi:macro domain-containing protein [Paenibacillus harenae]|uniref:macro domain-containing protein n=1 Tax=Paenibacillus harenae TaxID=306543 RepID=UPI0004914ACD|nr:macro domain-containing protein [Paenibacillus harenae]